MEGELKMDLRLADFQSVLSGPQGPLVAEVVISLKGLGVLSLVVSHFLFPVPKMHLEWWLTLFSLSSHSILA